MRGVQIGLAWVMLGVLLDGGSSRGETEAHAIAIPPALATEDALSQWTTYYYLHPDSSLVVPAIRQLAAFGYFDDDADATDAPLIGFLSGLFAQSPTHIEAWLRELDDLDPHAKDVVKRAVELANLPEKDFLALEVTSPAMLDLLWGRFLSSGEAAYARRVMSILPWKDQHEDLQQAIIGEAAYWSLTSNALQHERVLALCRHEMKTSSASVRAILAEIVRRVEAERAKPAHADEDSPVMSQ